MIMQVPREAGPVAIWSVCPGQVLTTTIVAQFLRSTQQIPVRPPFCCCAHTYIVHTHTLAHTHTYSHTHSHMLISRFPHWQRGGRQHADDAIFDCLTFATTGPRTFLLQLPLHPLLMYLLACVCISLFFLTNCGLFFDIFIFYATRVESL